VSQQQRPDAVSIDYIPVDIDTTQSAEIDPADAPDEIESITRVLAGEQPPTNRIVVLKAARWWYLHGKGGADPAFQWAIQWTRHLATDTPSDGERFDAFCEYLVTVGFADERHNSANVRLTSRYISVDVLTTGRESGECELRQRDQSVTRPNAHCRLGLRIGSRVANLQVYRTRRYRWDLTENVHRTGTVRNVVARHGRCADARANRSARS
jgi:hypothetical protein